MGTDSRDVTAIYSNGGIIIGHRSAEQPPRPVLGVLAWAGAPRFTHTGTLSNQIPDSVTIPAGVLYAGASIRVRALYSRPAGTTANTIGILLNGAALGSPSMFSAASLSARFDVDCWVAPGGILTHALGSASVGASAAAVPALFTFTPGAALTVAPYFTLQTAGDSCTLEGWRVEVTAPDV